MPMLPGFLAVQKQGPQKSKAIRVHEQPASGL